MTVTFDVLEALGAHYGKAGNANAAARCFALALTMVMPTECEARIRFRYGCLLLPYHKTLAFEQLERALRLGKSVGGGDAAQGRRLRVGILCAMVTAVANKQLMTELFKEHIVDVSEDTVVAFMCAFLQAAVVYQFDVGQSVELIENAIGAFPSVGQLLILRCMYALVVGRAVDLVEQPQCALSTFLNLTKSISQQDHNKSERLLSLLLPFKLDSYRLHEHVVLFQNSFRFAIKSLCIIQSSIDGRTPHTELYLASEKVILKSPNRMSAHIRDILNTIKHIDGNVRANAITSCVMYDLHVQAQNIDTISDNSDQGITDYQEFVNSCKLIIQGNTPIHHIKSKLLLTLKHVNTVSQDAFLRAAVMLLLGLMYVGTDRELAEKMFLVADRFGKSCNNKAIMSFL